MIKRILKSLGYVPAIELEIKSNLLREKTKKTKAQQREVTELQKKHERVKDDLSKVQEQLENIKNPKLDSKKLYEASKRARERDGKCIICSSTEKLSVHHLYDKEHHPTLAYTDSNLVCLCEKHHVEFHKKYNRECDIAQFKKFFFEKEGHLNSTTPFILWK